VTLKHPSAARPFFVKYISLAYGYTLIVGVIPTSLNASFNIVTEKPVPSFLA
jgi:hypothetical protein